MKMFCLRRGLYCREKNNYEIVSFLEGCFLFYAAWTPFPSPGCFIFVNSLCGHIMIVLGQVNASSGRRVSPVRLLGGACPFLLYPNLCRLFWFTCRGLFLSGLGWAVSPYSAHPFIALKELMRACLDA